METFSETHHDPLNHLKQNLFMEFCWCSVILDHRLTRLIRKQQILMYETAIYTLVNGVLTHQKQQY